MTFPLVLPPLQVHYDLLQEGWGEKIIVIFKTQGYKTDKKKVENLPWRTFLATGGSLSSWGSMVAKKGALRENLLQCGR